MDLIESYLNTVKSYLPRKQREDIIAELSDEIRSQVEEKESELGRALDESELNLLLIRFGDPVAIAARYRQPRHSVALGRELIGPEIFPYYMWILMISGLVTLGWVIYAIVHDALNVPMILVSIVIQFVTITAVVAVIDYVRRKFPHDWLIPPTRMTPLLPIARWRSISGLIFLVVSGIWWTLLPYFPSLYFGATANLSFTPGFLAFTYPVTTVVVLGMAQRLVNLFRPDWTWLPPITRVIVNLLGLAIVYSMIKAYPYVAVVDASVNPTHYEYLAGVFNAIILWGFLASWLWIFFLINSIVNLWMCPQHILHLFRVRAKEMDTTQDESH